MLNALITLAEEKAKPHPNEAIIACCEVILRTCKPRENFTTLSHPEKERTARDDSQ